MSAAPRHPDGIGYAGLRMTADEFSRLGETPDHYELIDGVVLMSPGPSYRHQKIMAMLFRQIDRFAEAVGADLVTDTDLRLADNLVYRPDILYFPPRRIIGSPQTITAVPDLVIEILSPASRSTDLVTKRTDYERFGVAEYWAVDPDNGNVRAFQRTSPAGLFSETLVAGSSLVSTSLRGFTLDLLPIRAVCTAR